MKTPQFRRLLKQFHRSCWKLLDVKGKDYTRGGSDRLFNFKSFSEFGVTPQKAWLVYAKKHWDAICSYINNVGESEPIESRLQDLANYCGLLYCIIKEDVQPRG